MTIIHILAGVVALGTCAALAVADEPPWWTLHSTSSAIPYDPIEPTPAGMISGRATVIDGDTLRIGNQKIRLWGIDAPERNQPCGPQATAKLRELTNGPVSCAKRSIDIYGRIVAQCFAMGDIDLGRAMVAAGLANDVPKYSHGFYAQAVTNARCNFSSPEEWRRRK